ncbi:unnamed protein product [Hermetia illucens]|uniref:Salivary secreted peptide n=1 Tax=Hermetia illucens TaxID=343691 RepID=A0A7R8YP14_HERIL|nr:probable salivary secreted peptide [Hermetia illucens]CAD7079020.1 unnamed protein product [Hermetia illucens]
MRYLVALTLAVLSICAYTVSAQSHNVTWGAIGQYDILLDSQVVQEKYKFLRVVSEDFTFPTKGRTNYYTITAVRCIDQYTNGNGGYATLVSGGPGAKNVTIHLKSKRDHGFNFLIQIYGRY